MKNLCIYLITLFAMQTPLFASHEESHKPVKERVPVKKCPNANALIAQADDAIKDMKSHHKSSGTISEKTPAQILKELEECVRQTKPEERKKIHEDFQVLSRQFDELPDLRSAWQYVEK